MTDARALPTGIRTATYDFLRAAESLTGVDGAGGVLGTSDHPSIFPHGAPARQPFPYVVFKRTDRPEARTLTKTRDGLRGVTFDFEIWGDDTLVVEQIAEAMNAHLEGFLGAHGNVSVRTIELQGEVDDSVRPEDGSEVTWYVTVLTARLIYRAVPTGA